MLSISIYFYFIYSKSWGVGAVSLEENVILLSLETSSSKTHTHISRCNIEDAKKKLSWTVCIEYNDTQSNLILGLIGQKFLFVWRCSGRKYLASSFACVDSNSDVTRGNFWRIFSSPALNPFIRSSVAQRCKW